MIGKTLGHYRIEAKLGESDNGEAYRAVDTLLDRAVAVRILPAPFSGTSQKRERFAEEVKSLSALGHRNIVGVLDVESAGEGVQAVTWMATEYVAGRTLDKVIGRKGLPWNQALRYAAQIADALAAAHGAGVIHGGLKPSNILVTDQDEIKILNFGVARLAEAEEADVHAATESVHAPLETSGLGSKVAYLSPEQADGHPASERSDIFAFGAILYEMIRGRRAFQGSSTLSTLAAVIHQDPAPLEGAGGEVSHQLERILKRCLRKDPKERWQRMASVKLALEDLLQEGGSEGQGQARGSALNLRGRWLWLALASLVAALAAGGYVGARADKTPQPTFERLTYRRGNVAEARFSPDGTVLFSAQWGADPTRIFSLRPGRNEYRPIDLPEARILSISSQGEVAILLGSSARGVPGTLARVPLSGGAPREVLEDVADADWSPDGAKLAVSHIVGGRSRIEYPIGTVLAESEGRPAYDLHVSRKGDSIAYFDYDSAVADFAVTVLDLNGRKRVLSRGWRGENGLAWSPKGDEIWYSGSKTGGEPALHAVKLNGDDRILEEAPARISLLDVTRDGRVLAAVEDSRMGILGLAPGQTQERDLAWFDASRIYDISADGKTILFLEQTYGESRNPAIFVRKTDGSPAVRLGDGSRPMLSPDGKWVACVVSAGQKTTLTLLPTGAGVPRTIGSSGMRYESVEWFPDGRKVLFNGSEANRSPRSFVQDVNGGKPAPLTPEGTLASRVSPDGRYATVVAGGELSLLPIQGGDLKPVTKLEPGETVIRWSGDGRSLFLRKPDGPASLEILRLDVMTGRRQRWKALAPPDSVGVQIGQVVLTPDGNSYAYSFTRDISTLYLVQGLQ